MSKALASHGGEPEITPLMAQYLAIKAEHPGSILLYEMGDFFEMYLADATEAAAALDIALTTRGQYLGGAMPMCGVPVHAAKAYVLTLLRKGFSVAICRRTKDPAEARGRGAVARREVVATFSPSAV